MCSCPHQAKTSSRLVNVHVDDVLGGGDDVSHRTVLDIQQELDIGPWDVGAMRFKGRQLHQMSNREILIHMEHNKHELSQIEVSKEDKLKPERSLTAKELTRYRGGQGSIGWLVPLLEGDRQSQSSPVRNRSDR